MTHPLTRAERRHQRDRVIARRRFIYQHIWNAGAFGIQERTNPFHCGGRLYFPDFPTWGRYAKWNLGCGSRLCHADKYFGRKRKRREALKRAAREWQQFLDE